MTLKLAYQGILMEQRAVGDDVESSTFEQVCECIRQALVSLEEIKEMHELQTLQSILSIVYTSVGLPPFVLPRELSRDLRFHR